MRKHYPTKRIKDKEEDKVEVQEEEEDTKEKVEEDLLEEEEEENKVQKINQYMHQGETFQKRR